MTAGRGHPGLGHPLRREDGARVRVEHERSEQPVLAHALAPRRFLASTRAATEECPSPTTWRARGRPRQGLAAEDRDAQVLPVHPVLDEHLVAVRTRPDEPAAQLARGVDVERDADAAGGVASGLITTGLGASSNQRSASRTSPRVNDAKRGTGTPASVRSVDVIHLSPQTIHGMSRSKPKSALRE